MRDVVITTDLYHQHADPNDHWNLATLFALASKGYIRLAGIMCDDDRALAEDGSYLHFGDPSVQSVAQLNYITGMAVPVGFGSRHPIKCEEDVKKALSSGRKISSVTMLLDIMRASEDGVDIHMCGSCKDVLLAYRHSPKLFSEKCHCIYLNAGTYMKQEPVEYNVSLEPYAYSQIFKIPCKICWSPCFDELRPWPYKPSERANFYSIAHKDAVPHMSEALKKYFNYMFGKVFHTNWLTYLKEPLDTELLDSWIPADREMWSTPGYLMSAEKSVNAEGKIVDINSPDAVFNYYPVSVEATEEGKIFWADTDTSNIYMFRNTDPCVYNDAMGKAVIKLLSEIGEIY